MLMKENNEIVQKIAEDILHHRKLETKELRRPDKNLAIGLSNVRFIDENMKIWLTTKDNEGGYHKIPDITGYTGQTVADEPTTITHDGKVVNKNTRIGEVLIKNSDGIHQVQTKRGLRPLQIFNLSVFIPDHHHAEAFDLTIDINESKIRRYQKLTELIASFKKAEETIAELKSQEKSIIGEKEKNVKQENKLKELARQIEEQRRKRDETLAKAQSFIRKSAELRYQPILDKWQEDVKRSNIYSGTLAIDGGPGTGKTTALIQRIKFLLDKEAMLGSQEIGQDFISEGYFPKMNDDQKRVLFDSRRNWVFFSPNALLKLFLRNNMIQEGLQADDSRVLIWGDYLTELIRDYKLVNTELPTPFLFLRTRQSEGLLPYSSNNLKSILDGLESFFLTVVSERLQKIGQIKADLFFWKIQGLSIQNYINRQEKSLTIDSLIRLFFNLQENYIDEVKQLTTQFTELNNIAASKVLQQVEENISLRNEAYAFAEEWIRTSGNAEDEDTDNEDEEEEEEEIEAQINETKVFLYDKLKILVKNVALSKHDNTVRLSKKYVALRELIKLYFEIESIDTLDRIGQLAYFNKYFVRITRGLVSNLLSDIPKIYKAFRKIELTTNSHGWNYDLLKFIVEDEKSKNKRLHPEEQSLLIYFINKIIAKSYKFSVVKGKAIRHPYFEAFRNHSVPVIGVDEASDFHIIDLLAMHSLSDLNISSVTFSGDIMQRLTEKGIRQWEDLNNFISPLSIKELRISYRQSPTLLEIASALYEKATNKKARYESYMERDSKEPSPLLFKNNNEDAKINWIAKRIWEIHNAYGRQLIPSIAIFLPNDNEVEQFSKKLSEIDELADVGINVRASKDGQVLGDRNMVRVFPIDFIKGMEFEAVFFHNLHLLSRRYQNQEIIMKNLYVGLSRASFYMGVTADENVEDFNFLDGYFSLNNHSWRL